MMLARWRIFHSFTQDLLSSGCGLGTRDSAVNKTHPNPCFHELTFKSGSCYSVAKSCPVFLWPRGLQHARFPSPSPSPGVCPSSCPLNRWCNPTTSFSAALFSFAFDLSQHQVFFPMSRLFASSVAEVKILGSHLTSPYFSFSIESIFMFCSFQKSS